MYFDQTGIMGPDVSEMSGLESEYVQTQCVMADGGDRYGVCALAFDQSEELLWMGNQGGHVTSYYTGHMQKYTSFQVHQNQDIRQILTMDEGILALTATSLRCQIRRGIPVFTHTSAHMTEMQCMLQLSPHRLLLGGHKDKLIDFNMAVCKETKRADVGDAGCVMLRGHSRFVCAGNPLGRIDLRDPNSLKVEHTLETHSGSLSDFDIQGNLLVTCGFSSRQGGNLSVDRFLMVYDLRMMRAVSPIQTVVDPLYLRFLPSVSSRLAVVTALGQAQLVDTVALSNPKLSLLQMENPGTMCLAFDISSSNQAMCFGDNAGSMHLFSSREDVIFNSYSRMTEHADTVASYPNFGIDDYDTPLSVIPMPLISTEVLASDWPAHLMANTYRRAPAIDPEILRTMKMQGPIGYAPNPKASRRNQVMYNLESNGVRSQSKQYSESRNFKQPVEESAGFVAIPKRYRKVEVKYNKLGVEDFQFDQYNKSGFPGLEAMLPNAYCNAMIQVLYYTEPLRATLLSHLCEKEFCLSCELGFLFHMLSTCQNTPCQPGNFLRAFRTVPEASALGLILSDLHPEAKMKVDLGALIQSWNRFILHQMHVEILEIKKKREEGKINRKPFVYKETDFPAILGGSDRKKNFSSSDVNLSKLEDEKREEITEISQLLGTKQLHINSCLKCNHEVRKESILLACNLVYPTNEPERDEWSFCDILKRSLTPEQVTPAWCDECSKFTPTSQARVLQSLPKLLAINTGLHNPQHKLFWQSQMDKIVAKAATTGLDTTPTRSSTPTSSISSSKPCRYGDNCSRPGCRFRHSFDVAPQQSTSSNPYCSNNWLPHRLRMILKNDHLSIRKLELDSDEPNEDDGESMEYNLTGVVCYITEPSTQERKNLVALIKVPGSYMQDGNNEPAWYLFNDFSISCVPAHEATWFSLDWKTPCVLYYSTDEVTNASTNIFQSLNKDIFTQVNSIARGGGSAGITFTPLAEHEMPMPGDLVAMDAEFVTLNQEEAELRSDGKMSTIKPSQMSVARITCIRGQGPLEGIPFIDDYISTQEQVVDYLTKFSGIKPGDLDANFSSKHLTTLKSTYIKLRFLQDSGVTFVGHGLKNDFRVINLVVPPEQVVDTVFLFHLPHHRMVSLRFLAWHFLGLKIQSETHDSTEDARAALQLYRRYKELEQENKIGDALSELYETGKILNWKVPEDESHQ
ncbi:PREDICTED: PAB-dependent poly(A)-specific ribonuclease subunit PAN2 isoform X1 [Nicrophorus vespilloides]|uniref:PAN2-PAN3 deadenylation complex catalytic subunit PAN2 n=2 Tax=Nicrophorus vespilloides TaxID=110193 RepID=A0ABM1M8V9_NICVS|nr:PREDICTED: PAB-dependent poly(A)-specific ribonuclease subunit PAN2 isoform X1 [Nicrophorus vespilloides]